MDFKYMYGKQEDQYSFIHIPKMLVTEKIFTGITIHAKVLYGLLLDRMGMAVKNNGSMKETGCMLFIRFRRSRKIWE